MSKKYDLPIWVHPSRTAKFADYASEGKSKYEIWWLFGWPYETSAFMARLVFSQMFEKLPRLRIITHHLGAMAPRWWVMILSRGDRKSTRLNSSHSQISYAVFCLKKKK